MDVGCGTGILSMFASKAGAKKIISIDQSEIIYQAMDIVQKNSINNIVFVKGRLEDTGISDSKVDIIISEWMGYMLLFEGMLDSVIFARDNHLAAGGLLLPNRCTINLCGLGDLQKYSEIVGFWDNVYGFDMSCIKKEVLQEASVELCKKEFVLTDCNVLADLNLMTVDVNCTNFSYNFNLEVKQKGHLTALVGYFDTFFELPSPVTFSTAPWQCPTHWKQVVFYLKTPLPVDVGNKITGQFKCCRDRKDVRALVVEIKMHGQELKYHLN